MAKSATALGLAGLVILALVVLGQGQKFLAAGRQETTDYCYSTDLEHPQYQHLATRTPYQLAKAGEAVSVPSGCTPSKFWIVNRHGTRLPTSSKIEKLQALPKYQAEILDNYAKGNAPSQGGLCPSDLTLLTNWQWDANITTDKDGFLTTQGWDDLKGIAQHYKGQFPSLFGDYAREKYFFQFSNSQRTEASYKGFVEGLFGEGAWEKIAAPEASDELLRPYQACPLWRAQEDALQEEDSELSKFARTDVYKKAVADISAKAGYATPLSNDVVDMMFEMCGLEVGWQLGQLSPWCTLFNMEQTKIFEYAADIEDWLVTGPVSTLNERLTCVIMQDLLRRMEDKEGETVTAYFSHSTLVQLFLTGLGYTHDQLANPLRGDNYEQLSGRSFSTSFNSPLASNVAVVRYDCGADTKVQFLLNEKPLQLSWCANGLCNWSDVKERFKDLSTQTCSTYHCSGAASRWLSLMLFVVCVALKTIM